MTGTVIPERTAMSTSDKLRAAADALLSDEGFDVAADSIFDTKGMFGLPTDGPAPADTFVERLALDLYRAAARIADGQPAVPA